MKNLILTGFMGTGKTTIGRIVSERLSMDFADTDQLAEKIAGMSIYEMFSRFGEPYFRRVEKEAVKKVCSLANCVVATGGGTLLDEENFRLLASTGPIVCLTASPTTILRNVEKCPQARPLLEGRYTVEYIDRLIRERERYYNKADFFVSIEDRDPQQVASRVIECYINAGAGF